MSWNHQVWISTDQSTLVLEEVSPMSVVLWLLVKNLAEEICLPRRAYRLTKDCAACPRRSKHDAGGDWNVMAGPGGGFGASAPSFGKVLPFIQESSSGLRETVPWRQFSRSIKSGLSIVEITYFRQHIAQVALQPGDLGTEFGGATEEQQGTCLPPEPLI
jgi:hypothetical protein